MGLFNFMSNPASATPPGQQAAPPTGPGASGMGMPLAMSLLSAGAGMLDPRGTYGNFGASFNRGVRQGMATYGPMWQQQQLQQQVAAAQAEQQHRARLQQQIATMVQQGATPQQIAGIAAQDPELMKSVMGSGGLMQIYKPPPAEPLEKAMVNGQPQFVPRSQAVGMQPLMGGTQLSVGPNGEVRYATGGQPLPGLPKKLGDVVAQQQFDVQERMARLKDIEKQFDPRFLQLPTQLGMKWSALKDKSGLASLAPAEKEDLQRYQSFRQAVLQDQNLYIKSITGAAMTDSEAKRIIGGMANMDDSPTEFTAKSQHTIEQARAANIRYLYAQRHGINWQSIPLYAVPDLLDKRGEEIEKALRQANPNATDVQIEEAARKQLGAEFGL